MALSRNKVAVPEGAAGTSPFWSLTFEIDLEIESKQVMCCHLSLYNDLSFDICFELFQRLIRIMVYPIGESRGLLLSLVAQLVRALH